MLIDTLLLNIALFFLIRHILDIIINVSGSPILEQRFRVHIILIIISIPMVQPRILIEQSLIE